MEEIFNKERVYVIEIYNENLSENFVINEIYSLITSANAIPCGYKVVKLRQITPSTYIGKGKIDEISIELKNLNADTVVFDGALTPSQTVNLAEALGVKVIDRTT